MLRRGGRRRPRFRGLFNAAPLRHTWRMPAAATFQPGRTYPRTILVVDDDPVVCGLIVHHLRAPGVRISADTGGLGLLDRIGTGFEVIVLDLQMPGVSGFDVLETLGARDERRPLPVVVLTSRSAAGDIAKAFALGAAGYALKPVDWPSLQRKISEIYMASDR